MKTLNLIAAIVALVFGLIGLFTSGALRRAKAAGNDAAADALHKRLTVALVVTAVAAVVMVISNLAQ